MSKTSDGPPNGPAPSARRSTTATTTPRSTSLPTRNETTLHAVSAAADGAQLGLRSSGVQKQDPNPPPPLGATGRELGTSPRRLQHHQMLNSSPEAGTRRGGPADKDTRTREHRISAEPLEPRDGVHKSKRQQTPRFRVTGIAPRRPGCYRRWSLAGAVASVELPLYGFGLALMFWLTRFGQRRPVLCNAWRRTLQLRTSQSVLCTPAAAQHRGGILILSVSSPVAAVERDERTVGQQAQDECLPPNEVEGQPSEQKDEHCRIVWDQSP